MGDAKLTDSLTYIVIASRGCIWTILLLCKCAQGNEHFKKVMVLETVGLPSEAVATILSVDWLLDRFSKSWNLNLSWSRPED